MRFPKRSLNLLTALGLVMFVGGALAQTASPADPSGTVRDAAAAVRAPGSSSPILAVCVDQDMDGWFLESSPGPPPDAQVATAPTTIPRFTRRDEIKTTSTRLRRHDRRGPPTTYYPGPGHGYLGSNSP
jgi:hypothetical protein